MNEAIAIPEVMTTELATGRINVALTKENFSVQALSDRESKLVYTEDNLPLIQEVMEDGRKMKKVLETLRKTFKEPYFRAGKNIDDAANAIQEHIDAILKLPDEKYTSMCRDIENRKREAEADRQRKQAILSGIDSNMVTFSQRISDCKTDADLVAIERLINLEKANKKKYAEFYDQALEKYSTLTSLLTLQKERVREFKELEKQRLEAEKKGDDEKLMAIHEQQVTLDAKIDEAKVTVQEAAVNQSMSQVTEVREVIPEVKARHKMWTWEVANIQETVKKMPSWTKVETVNDKIDEFLKASKDSWVESGKEEVTVNGIKFFLRKTY